HLPLLVRRLALDERYAYVVLSHEVEHDVTGVAALALLGAYALEGEHALEVVDVAVEVTEGEVLEGEAVEPRVGANVGPVVRALDAHASAADSLEIDARHAATDALEVRSIALEIDDEALLHVEGQV